MVTVLPSAEAAHEAACKATDLTDSELDNSELATLAGQAGYASLRAMLNDLKMWGSSLADARAFLEDQLSGKSASE